jgi:hypothetical protein
MGYEKRLSLELTLIYVKTSSHFLLLYSLVLLKKKIIHAGETLYVLRFWYIEKIRNT